MNKVDSEPTRLKTGVLLGTAQDLSFMWFPRGRTAIGMSVLRRWTGSWGEVSA
jgi:hypothetical protein